MKIAINIFLKLLTPLSFMVMLLGMSQQVCAQASDARMKSDLINNKKGVIAIKPTPDGKHQVASSKESVTYTVKGHSFVASTSKMIFSDAVGFCKKRSLRLGDQINLFSILLRLSKQYEFDDFVWSSGLSYTDPETAYAVHVGKRKDGQDEAVTELKRMDNKLYAFCG